MDRQAKILILHASVGFGHTKAAKAIEEAFKEDGYFSGIQCVDTNSLGSKLYQTIYTQSYVLQVKFAPWLWGVFYHSFNVRWVYRGIMRFVRHAFNRLGSGPLERFLIQENPAVIISTHFYSVEVASYLKKHGKIRSKIISVITDFLPHHVWVSDQVDAYITASQESKQELGQMGVRDAQVKIFGIPIEKKFGQTKDRAAILNKIGLNVSGFTVLVTSGGAGLSSTQQIVEGIEKIGPQVQMMVVCGKNEKMRRFLEMRFSKDSRVKIFGFVNNMDELMEASDLVIGKGGGLTISESLAKQKPLILFQSVPGQETRNDGLLQKYSAAYATSSPSKLVAKVKEILQTEELLKNMKKGVAALSKPYAAQDILEFVKNEL